MLGRILNLIYDRVRRLNGPSIRGIYYGVGGKKILLEKKSGEKGERKRVSMGKRLKNAYFWGKNSDFAGEHEFYISGGDDPNAQHIALHP